MRLKKGVRSQLSERPFGCFAQLAPDFLFYSPVFTTPSKCIFVTCSIRCGCGLAFWPADSRRRPMPGRSTA